jgi:hypothetical protein
VSFTPPAGCANFTQRQAQVVVGADVIILDLSATCLF